MVLVYRKHCNLFFNVDLFVVGTASHAADKFKVDDVGAFNAGKGRDYAGSMSACSGDNVASNLLAGFNDVQTSALDKTAGSEVRRSIGHNHLAGKILLKRGRLRLPLMAILGNIWPSDMV